MLKLNVASGPCIFAGWVNLDKVDMASYVGFLRTTGLGGLPKEQAELARRVQAAEAAGQKTDFRVHDLRRGLPFDDNSVDFLYFGQAIEHLNPLYEVPPFLKECHRVLRPGGLVRISTPDLDMLLASYLSGDMMEFAIEQPQPYRDAKSKALRLAYLMFGSLGPASTNEHYEGHHLTYCLAPGTRILTADLRYIPIETLRAGDELCAFDESPMPVEKRPRKWQKAMVIANSKVTRPAWRLTLEDDTVIIASSEHLWLTFWGGPHWLRTDRLRRSSKLMRLLPVWQTRTDYKAGYLAAAFDGEGCLSQRPNSTRGELGQKTELSFAQKDNAMLAKVCEYLNDCSYNHKVYRYAGAAVCQLKISPRKEVLRFLGEIRPVRLLANFDPDSVGRLTACGYIRVREREFLGDTDMLATETTTNTLIAEGLASHNSKQSIQEVLAQAGFVNVRFFAPGESQSSVFSEECQDTGVTHSLYAEAKKPA